MLLVVAGLQSANNRLEACHHRNYIAAAIVDETAAPWHTFVALLGRSLAVERLTLDQVGGVRIPAPQPSLFPYR
jgi:hypothetical protein